MTWRPRGGFRVGKMRERITVQTPAETLDAAGQPIKSWADTYTNEPASYEPAAGTETIRGRQLEAGVTAVFVVRYRPGYTTELRVGFGSDTYGIVHVKRVEGGQRYIELHCKAVELAPTPAIFDDEVPTNTYLRPDGSSTYLRPDGSSTYLRPAA